MQSSQTSAHACGSEAPAASVHLHEQERLPTAQQVQVAEAASLRQQQSAAEEQAAAAEARIQVHTCLTQAK